LITTAYTTIQTMILTNKTRKQWRRQARAAGLKLSFHSLTLTIDLRPWPTIPR